MQYPYCTWSVLLFYYEGDIDFRRALRDHPDIDIRWNKVTLALTTHDAGGLTDKDYSLALACDELYLRR